MGIATALPGYQMGKHVVTCTLQALIADNAGVYTTFGSSADIVGLNLWMEFDMSATVEAPLVAPANVRIANYIPIRDDFEISIHELKVAGVISYLEILWSGYDYFRVEARHQWPGVSQTMKYAAILSRNSIDTNLVHEENVVVMKGKPAGAFPYYGIGTPPF